MDKARESFAWSHQIIEGYWRDRVADVSSRSDEERARAKREGVHYYTRADLASGRPELNEEHARIARFEVLLSEPDLFRAEVLNAIAAVRAELKLPPADAEIR